MYIIKAEAHFDSAHFLPLHKGKCRNIHGHRWKIEAEVYSKQLNDRGMVVDFSELKSDLREIADYYDHALIIKKESLNQNIIDLLKIEQFKISQLSFDPTAENFAKHFFELLNEKNYKVKKITVYETPENSASCEVPYEI